ncbi:MAG: hypothetical protein MJ089_05695 [Ruminococcus sp.]|nr:hypothetical protein [Ruminococcus sp.]
MSNQVKKFIFENLPENVEHLKNMPEASLKDPFATAALTVAVLCRYGESVQNCIDMLNYLKGPQQMSPYEIQFLRDRLSGKFYKSFSFFEGTSPQNGYNPTKPYTIIISDNVYSYQDEGYVRLDIKSSGADSPRQVKLRLKPSTGQWFLWEQYLLSDIRIPVEEDPWA